LKKAVDSVFDKAGIAISEDGSADTTIKISVENVADMGDAAAKGFGTGLTLGLAGSTVTDGYEFKISMSGANGTVEKNYSHALHSTVGNKKAPIEGVEASASPTDGFNEIVEDILLTFLKEVKGSNMIANNQKVAIVIG